MLGDDDAVMAVYAFALVLLIPGVLAAICWGVGKLASGFEAGRMQAMNKSEVAGNVLGGLLGAAVAIVCLLAWMTYEDWRQDHGH